LWSWSSKRSKDFNEAANIPFEDDEMDALSRKESTSCK
jgi:cytochrome c oxidase cbb3-type subunit 4